MEGGEHARICVPEVAEVVVRRVLAAEDRAVCGHLRLDEGVADPGADRGAAVFAYDLRDREGGDQVVDDRAPAAVAGQFPGRDQGGDRRRGDARASLVHDEAAVRVAVEGQAEVGALGHHPGLEVDDVRGVERVGLVVRERAVQLEVHRDQFEPQACEDRRDRVAAHAVAGVHDHLEGRISDRSTRESRWAA